MPIEPGDEAKQEGSQHNDKENSDRGPLLVTQPAVAGHGARSHAA